MARVLIIDDEPDIRLLVRFHLEAAGHEVVEAGSGRAGLAAAADDAIALVLLDLRLPDMDGWDVLAELCNRPEPQRVPVVVMSAHASPGTLKRAEDAGAKGYVIKPFVEADLLRWLP